MSFIHPWALIGLIGVPILILIYIIKHRYREEIVPSTFLWKRSLKYMKKRLPFNLKNIILLLLQIMAVTLAVLVVARPTIPKPGDGEIIAIVDASSSMMTVDADGKTRLERAKLEVAKYAEDVNEHNRMTVISAGDVAKKLVNRTDRRQTVVNSLEEIEFSWGAADISGALELAQVVRQENVGCRVLFFTDTTYEMTENVETVLITNQEWNAAALDLKVEQLNNGAFNFTGRVASYGESRELNVFLYVDGKYVQAKKVTCADGVETEVAFREYEAVNYQTAEIRLELGKDVTDALSYDNSFSVHKPTDKRLRVELIFGPDSYDEFLSVALSAAEINKQVVHIDKLTSNGTENRKNESGGFEEPKIKYEGYAAYIFVGVLPEYMPADGTTWLMNPPNVSGQIENLKLGISMGDKVTDSKNVGYTLTPVISANDKDFSILKGLTFVDTEATNQNDNSVKVLSYQAISVVERETGSEMVAESDYEYKEVLSCEMEGKLEPVMMVGKNTKTHGRVIISTMHSSSLTANLEFTLLVNNLIRGYASPQVFTEANGGIKEVGDSLDVTLPIGTIGIEVLKDNTTISLEGSRTYSQNQTEPLKDCSITFTEPGDYTVRLHVVYVNEFGEHDEPQQIEYSKYVKLAASESDSYQTLPELVATIPEDGKSITVPVEIWFYLLIALLVVLMGEWLVYHHA